MNAPRARPGLVRESAARHASAMRRVPSSNAGSGTPISAAGTMPKSVKAE